MPMTVSTGRKLAPSTTRRLWTDDDIKRLKHLVKTVPIAEIAKRLDRTPVAIRVKIKELGLKRKKGRPPTVNRSRRFASHGAPDPNDSQHLRLDHAAVVGNTTRYPGMVRLANGTERVLKSGEHNTKIGGRVRKGALKGAPIFTLTLTERATCPRSCAQYLNCYGNRMHLARRFEAGPDLERELVAEIAELSGLYPDGFIVRAHILGDFYSQEYVWLWADFLKRHAPLNVFGFTHWHPGTKIGDTVRIVRDMFWPRFAIRFSNLFGDRNAVVLPALPVKPKVGNGIVCPEQWDAIKGCKNDRHCGTCALCWSTDKPIVFVEH